MEKNPINKQRLPSPAGCRARRKAEKRDDQTGSAGRGWESNQEGVGAGGLRYWLAVQFLLITGIGAARLLPLEEDFSNCLGSAPPAPLHEPRTRPSAPDNRGLPCSRRKASGRSGSAFPIGPIDTSDAVRRWRSSPRSAPRPNFCLCWSNGAAGGASEPGDLE